MFIKRIYQNLIRLLLIRVLFQGMSKFIKPTQQHWQSYWQKLNHFQQNIFIGCFITLIITLSHHSAWLQEMENFAMDSMMQVNQSLPRLSATQQNLQFTLLDINETSYRDWGEPFYTPRDKLTTLIRLAAKQQAKIIIVDIDISHAGHQPKADRQLEHFLRQYDDKKSPPLILLRSFYPSLTNPLSNPTNAVKQAQLPKLRPLFFDENRIGNRIFWAQPLFKKTNSDQQVRYWHLLKAGCKAGYEQNPAILLPSYQLLSHALLQNKYDKLSEALQIAAPADCQTLPPDTLEYNDKTLTLSSHSLGERIIYTLTGKETDDLQILPAKDLLKCQNQACANDRIKNRIVVIAASHAYAHDQHATPLGQLSGGLIIINAIKSFSLFGQISPPSAWIKWLIEIVLIISMAWLFSRFHSTTATLLTGSIIMLVLMPLSFYFFKFGIWIDFALPILAMQLHQMFAQWEENLHQKNEG
ncbi:CHASE2 domain-containing protein [Candidatus Venteria ishoeyi]|uniref:CHASE2 domain-containing protein n=1 Tax=Candidatus Venteria ishoeyi TaxID=1899563 RepID=UPI0025A58FC5|nr:CHASE2 domain-containing protein [Candidatus Venteria ishoeyi]MDM8546579.1 CHASE2 domain-containing protein [Candidatus Venteria ishoeyi]